MNCVPFTDPCRTFNCDHICVNARSGPKCLCYEGFILDSNNNSCIGIGFYLFLCLTHNTEEISWYKVTTKRNIRSSPYLCFKNIFFIERGYLFQTSPGFLRGVLSLATHRCLPCMKSTQLVASQIDIITVEFLTTLLRRLLLTQFLTSSTL